MGARSVGDLNGRSAFELLKYKAYGWSTNRKRPQSGCKSSLPKLRRNRTTVRTDTRPRTQGVCKLIGYFEENLGSASPAASRSNEVALSVNDLSTYSSIAREVDRFSCSLVTADNKA